MRLIRVAPVTAETLIVCVALYVGCVFQSIWNHERLDEVQRAWGAIQSRTFYDVHDGIPRGPELELHGPFDIWDGEWWRIPLSSFHHDNLVSLLLNLFAASYLGMFLERYWGHFAFALFLVPAVCLPAMVELATGNCVNGLSGANAALFGALIVLREFDQRLADVFPIEVAYIGLGAMALGLVGAQLSGWYDVPALAHIAGFSYGALIGWVFGGPLKQSSLLRWTIISLHLWIVPALWLVAHPSWSGRYFWYRAVTAQNLDWSDRNLERATHCDPSLTAVWLRWSQNAEVQHDPLEAWSRLIRGLVANPGSSPLMQGTRRLWRRLGIVEREYATEILEQFFGQRSGTWLAQIRSDGFSIIAKTTEPSDDVTPEINLLEFSLDQKLELPTLNIFTQPTNPSGPKAPIEPDEAVEGKTL